MHTSHFSQTIEQLIEKHHISNKDPAKRFDTLKDLANSLNFSKNIQGKIIQIAGTNGKGSTQKILWELLKAQGFSCHIFHSPHLIQINERIRLNNEMISDDLLLEKLLWADQQIQSPIGFFALLTIAFFQCCTETPADYIIIETGLGGEFDATNILTDHALSIITPISYDHCDVLGYDITDIAIAKAGIMRPHRPCFSALQLPEVKKLLAQHAESTHTPITFLADQDYEKLPHRFRLNSQIYCKPNLKGGHQFDNAAVTILAYLELMQQTNHPPIEQINQVLKYIHFDGRLHHVQNGKITQQLKHSLWIDGAHNPAGAEVLSGFLQTISEPIYFWINFKYNKDIKTILELTTPFASDIIFQCTQEEDRACQLDIENIAKPLKINIIYSVDINESINILNQQEKGLVIAFGSLHWIGKLLQFNKHI